MSIRHPAVLHSGRYELQLAAVMIHTVRKGSLCSYPISDFASTEVSVRAETEQVQFRLQKMEAGDVSLFRAKVRLNRKEDSAGNLISLPGENSLEMQLTLFGIEHGTQKLENQKVGEQKNGEKKPEVQEKGSFMSISQHKTWWMRPSFPGDLQAVPSRTQLMIIRSGMQDPFLVLMALCGDRTRADFEGIVSAGAAEQSGAGGIRVTVSSNQQGGTSFEEPVFACAVGADPYELIGRIYRELKRCRSYPFKMREEKSYPDIFRTLGWCTWDSLGQKVTEEAIFRKMDELREKQIPVKWVLIDDGWSWVDPEKQTLKSFRADPVKFPNGLAHTVRCLKENYGVEAVGVWQAFKGYWNGIDENFEDWLKVKDCLCRYGNGEISVKPDASSAFGFWDSWHSILQRDGIDFVKIDGQSSMQLMQQGVSTYGEGAQALYKGMEASVLLHFDGRVINCMGMAPENVMNRSVTALSRSSDDYLPSTSGSFYEHAMQNAYNNVYQGPLYYGDWDMFWTEHEDASRSALLRMISGGPVYISDAYGHTDPDLIRKITGADGKLLMCEDIGRPTLDCLTRDPFQKDSEGKGGILKIYNKRDGKILIACFAGESEGRTSIQLRDIPGMGQRQCQIMNTKTGEKVLCSMEMPYELFMNAREELLLELIP